MTTTRKYFDSKRDLIAHIDDLLGSNSREGLAGLTLEGLREEGFARPEFDKWTIDNNIPEAVWLRVLACADMGLSDEEITQ